MLKNTLRYVTNVETALYAWSERYGMELLRISIGIVFVLFGLLKFFPDVSPAQDIAQQTMSKLSFGLLPVEASILFVAFVEAAVGLCLVINRYMRLALIVILLEMLAILSPLVLLTGDLFTGPHHAPNILGQYILKDFILLAAVLVLLGARRRTS